MILFLALFDWFIGKEERKTAFQDQTPGMRKLEPSPGMDKIFLIKTAGIVLIPKKNITASQVGQNFFSFFQMVTLAAENVQGGLPSFQYFNFQLFILAVDCFVVIMEARF